jgi:hypothetical protein
MVRAQFQISNSRLFNECKAYCLFSPRSFTFVYSYNCQSDVLYAVFLKHLIYSLWRIPLFISRTIPIEISSLLTRFFPTLLLRDRKENIPRNTINIFKMVKTRLTLFWVMTPCNLVRGYQRLAGHTDSILEVEEQIMEAVCSSETSVTTYNTQDIYNMNHKNQGQVVA